MRCRDEAQVERDVYLVAAERALRVLSFGVVSGVVLLLSLLGFG